MLLRVTADIDWLCLPLRSRRLRCRWNEQFHFQELLGIPAVDTLFIERAGRTVGGWASLGEFLFEKRRMFY